MTKKHIFVYNLFHSLNISHFSLVFMYKLQPPPPPKKVTHSPSKPPYKNEVLPSPPPLSENLVGSSTPPAERGRGAHYEYYV